MTAPTVYLVSGATRGIGLGLVTHLATRPETIVFAGARDLNATAALSELVKTHSGKVHIVQLVSGDRSGNENAVKEIQSIAGRLDVVIANAGISNFIGPVIETPEEQMRDHYEVNVIGTHVLFCATYPLLAASTPTPKFVAISSMGGSITLGTPIPRGMLAYGASKAALNYLVRKIHFEYPELVCFPICPGAVATERVLSSSNFDAELIKKYNMMDVEESATRIIKLVVEATREKDGGRFVNCNGTTWEW